MSKQLIELIFINFDPEYVLNRSINLVKFVNFIYLYLILHVRAHVCLLLENIVLLRTTQFTCTHVRLPPLEI